MLFALGVAGSLLDTLQSLTKSKSSSATTSTDPGQASANPFDPGTSTQGQVSTGFSAGGCGPQISPQTMSALIDAQSQSGTTNTAPANSSDALKDLFSQIDADGDGSISKTEFENALGAGGTNLAAADDVFGKLDGDGDGSVSLDDMKSALQGAGHHGHHHHVHASASSASTDSTDTDGSTDPVVQALATNAPIKLTDLLKAIDKSQLKTISLDAMGSARAQQMFSSSPGSSLSVTA